MNTPNITPAQVAGIVTALGGQAVAFGLLSGQSEQLAVSLATIVAGASLKIADAIIRHGRSRALAGVQAAAIAQEAAAPASPSSTTSAGTVAAGSSSTAS